MCGLKVTVRDGRVAGIRPDHADVWSKGYICPKGAVVGHDRPGARLSVAARRPGANNNLLAPGDLIDVPSNNAVVNGIPVRVEAEK